MTSDIELRRAFARLADESVGTEPTGSGAARAAAHGAIRRARRRFAARVAVPIVALLAVGAVAGVSLRSSSGPNQVRTAGSPHAPSAAPARPLGRTPSVASPASASGGEALSQPITVGGWTITRVPTGTYFRTKAKMAIVDFGPEGTACTDKPAAAVTVLTDSGESIDSLLSQSTPAGPNTPLPMAGTTGVEEAPGSDPACPSEVLTWFQPRPGVIIQIATTTSGAAGAQLIAAGIQAASG